MQITKEQLQEQLATCRAEYKQIEANLYAMQGKMRTLEEMLAHLEAPEPAASPEPDSPSDPEGDIHVLPKRNAAIAE